MDDPVVCAAIGLPIGGFARYPVIWGLVQSVHADGAAHIRVRAWHHELALQQTERLTAPQWDRSKKHEGSLPASPEPYVQAPFAIIGRTCPGASSPARLRFSNPS